MIIALVPWNGRGRGRVARVGLIWHALVSAISLTHLGPEMEDVWNQMDGIGDVRLYLVVLLGYHPLDLVLDGGINDILDAQYVGLHGFKRRSLTLQHMLEGGRMKHPVNAFHFVSESVAIANIRQEKSRLIMAAKLLFKGEQITFIVVKGDQFGHFLSV